MSKLKDESEKMRLELKKSHAAETGRAGEVTRRAGAARAHKAPAAAWPSRLTLGAVAWSRPPVYDPSRCAVCTSRASLTHPASPGADRWKTPAGGD